MQNPTDYQIDDKGRLNSDGLYQKVKKNEDVNAHVKLHQEIRVWALKSAPP